MLRGRVDFAGSRDSQGVPGVSWWHRAWLKVSPPLCPCADGCPRWARVRILRPIATGSLLARGREPGEDQEVRLRRNAEAECAPKNWSTGKYLGGGRRWAVACAHWLPHSGGKTSADGLQMRLRAARSPPRKSAGAARRPSRDASFSEARGVRERSRILGKKSGSRNSPNFNRKIKKIG